ncbi:MT-A70 family methyltransferase [Frankia sp. Cj3]|uniref:MT-A70 family methyltransferase n=1 Tax=Frankia sp. Cj3 TaxID=2880976 RepID=UPI001EF3D9D2|nr:MT-A70 family methyltransferase [Frankia sp. Cj3]
MTEIGGPYQLLPALSDDDYARLHADIAERGVLVPIEKDECGNVLDGHHRLAICDELGITDYPRVVRRFGSEAEKRAHVIALNIYRRHLEPEARRPYIVELRSQGFTPQQIAEKAGVSDETVRKDLAHVKSSESKPLVSGDPPLPSHTVSKNGAVRPSSYKTKPKPAPSTFVHSPRDEERAREAFDLLGDDAPSGTEDVRRLAQKAAAKRVPEPIDDTPPMPTGLYRAVVIDPPWPMPKIEREERPNQGATLDYPTMTLDEITALPVPDLLDPEGAHVYLWTTHKFLPDALDLFQTWGIRYQCLMTWNKNVGITPFSWMYDTEHVLFGNFGAGLKLAQMGLRLSFSAPVQGHSVKPEIFYERVRAASPGARLDMFNRRDIDGFEPWGQEAARGI